MLLTAISKPHLTTPFMILPRNPQFYRGGDGLYYTIMPHFYILPPRIL